MYARLMILHQIFHFCERTLHPLYHPQGHDGLGHNLEKNFLGNLAFLEAHVISISFEILITPSIAAFQEMMGSFKIYIYPPPSSAP